MQVMPLLASVCSGIYHIYSKNFLQKILGIRLLEQFFSSRRGSRALLEEVELLQDPLQERGGVMRRSADKVP